MDPLEAVRLAWNVSPSTRVFSCHTPDIGTVRVWGSGRDAGTAFDVCATREWRTDGWSVSELTDPGTCECTIPYRASFTGKTDVRTEKDTPLGKNVRDTLDQMGFRDVTFHTDAMCVSLLRAMEETDDAFRGVPLVRSFTVHESDGRIRSDVCRLAILWSRGGYYFDNDLVLLENVARRIAPTTTFATVTTARWLFGNPNGLLNAFLACVPRHPIVHRALVLHARWPTMTANEKQRVTRGVSRPNIGTVLLRDAFRAVVGNATVFECERTGYCGGRIQLFREIAIDHDSEYNTSGLCAMCDVTQECNFAVADAASGDVLMKSRRVAQNGFLCPIRCPSATCHPTTPSRTLPSVGVRRSPFGRISATPLY